jgi:lipopolysaccharide transport system ATP-binding protein
LLTLFNLSALKTVVKVENLSKCYRLQHLQSSSRYTTLRDTMTQKIKNVFTRGDNRQESSELFWALKDVSFEVKDGERIGIIGRNGAGKSTLLKILSRITDPTGGRISIKGRVASLLEVGTGFHPELSGRENIFLNGAILGMSRTEIKSRFDEIVAFAEIDKFLDTPVKRYSSGMYVRLAFAVAAHLEPEILIVDEVLAVGDAQFQKKCLGKMQDVSRNEGRTILFVSHNIGAVRTLCQKAIFLKDGRIQKSGRVDEVLPEYMEVVKAKDMGVIINIKPQTASGEWEIGTDLSVVISWASNRFKPGWQCDVAGYSIEGTKVFALESEKFDEFNSTSDDYNGIDFLIRNVGFTNSDIRLDVGIKPAKGEPYSVLIENCATLSPSAKQLPSYKREDVITIPRATCAALKK